MASKGRILVVDDEKDIRFLIHEILEDEGYVVTEAAHSEAAFAAITESGMPDLVILDIWLENSDRDGMEILSDLKKRDAALPVLMISGHGNIEMAVNAIKLGAYDFIEKPFNTDRLLHLVDRATEAGRLKRGNGHARIEIIATSPEMQALMKTATKAAQGDARVMITGPAGAGRNHLAAWIHQESGRAGSSLMSVSCRNLDDAGLNHAIHAAGEGTLILRDIHTLPAATQKTLLKIATGKTACRLIATAGDTFKNDGQFSSDLYERLAVLTIDLPGLAGRRGDIGELAVSFMKESLNKWGQDTPVTLSDDALASLRKRAWSGHVAELQALCTMAAFRMMQAGTGDALPVHFEIQGGSSVEAAPVDTTSQEWLSHDLRTARESFERWYFENLSERFEGNISQMAAFVGMDRTALHRKLKALKEGDENGERLAS